MPISKAMREHFDKGDLAFDEEGDKGMKQIDVWSWLMLENLKKLSGNEWAVA